jgi:hypothetical protein
MQFCNDLAIIVAAGCHTIATFGRQHPAMRVLAAIMNRSWAHDGLFLN